MEEKVVQTNIDAPKKRGPRRKPMSSTPRETTTDSKPIVRKKNNLAFERDKDRKDVKGIFRFYEVPGGEMKFVFKKYKQDQPKRYKLRDGEVYTLPLGVAKHLNKECWYPLHQNAVDMDGKAIYKVGSKKRRCGFQSLEFIDPADFDAEDSNIVIAQKA